jgi:hypothetical protein
MRVYAVIEGSSEERFLNVVGEYLASRAIWLIPMRVRRGAGARGGGSSWQPWQRHITTLLKENKGHDVRATTMLDLYAIPRDTPGWTPPGSASGPQRADAMLQAIAGQIQDRRFLPYIQVYEFEALLFVDLDVLAHRAPNIVDARKLTELKEATRNLAPEEVNDGPMTAPSKRIEACTAGFRKTIHGLDAVKSIGLPRLRERCPRFDAWMTQLEQLAETKQLSQTSEEASPPENPDPGH